MSLKQSVLEILIKAKDKASKPAKDIDKSFKGLGSTIRGVGALLATYFSASAIGNLFSGAVRSASEFEVQMNRVRAAAGALTEQEFAALTEAAEVMGSTTRYTATQAAQGLEILKKSGISVEDTISALPTVLNLATAGSLSLGESAALVTDNLATFNLAIEDSSRVADVLAKGAVQANTSVDELGLGLREAALTANSLDISLEETVGYLDALANAGLRGSRAGTALKNSMVQLTTSGTAANKALQDIGINSTDFRTILEQLETTTEDTSEVFLKVGQEAAPALRAALQAGTADIDRFTEALKNADGATDDMAEAMKRGFSASLIEASSAWDGFRKQLVEPAMEEAAKYIQDITRYLQELTKDGTAAEIGKSIADGFKVFASALKDTLGVIVRFKDELVLLTKALVAIKLVKLTAAVGKFAAGMALSAIEIEKTSIAMGSGSKKATELTAKLKKIPTNIKISVGLAALLVAADAGEYLGKKLGELSEASESARKAQEDYNRSLRYQSYELQEIADRYEEYASTRLKSEKELRDLDLKAAASYEDRLAGLFEYQKAVYALALREKQLGTGSAEAVSEAANNLTNTRLKLEEMSSVVGRIESAIALGLNPAALDMVNSFNQIKETTNSTTEALTAMVEAVNLDSDEGPMRLARALGFLMQESDKVANQLDANLVASLDAAGISLESLSTQTAITAEQINTVLGGALRGMTTSEIADFTTRFATSLRSVGADSEVVAGIIREGLSKALTKAGVDAELFASEMTTAGKEAVQAFLDVSSLAVQAGEDIELTSNKIESTLIASLAKIKTERGLEELEKQIKALKGSNQITSESFDRMEEKVRETADKLKTSMGGAAEAGVKLANALQIDLDSASTVQQIEEVELALIRAFDSGEISADQFRQLVEQIPEKLRVVRTAEDTVTEGAEEIKEATKEVGKGFEEAETAATGFASSVSGWLNSLTESVWSLSAAAGQAFESGLFGREVLTELERMQAELQGVQDSTRSILASFSTSFDVTGLRRAWGEIALEANKVKEAYYQQSIAALRLRDNLRNMNVETLKGWEDTNRLSRQFGLLDSQSLDTLRNEIQSIREALEDAERAARDTVRSLRSELATLQGDTDTARRLDAEKEILDLELKIQQARQQGQDSVVAELEKALVLQRKIQAVERQKAREVQKAAAQAEARSKEDEKRRVKEAKARQAEDDRLEQERARSAEVERRLDMELKAQALQIKNLERMQQTGFTLPPVVSPLQPNVSAGVALPAQDAQTRKVEEVYKLDLKTSTGTTTQANFESRQAMSDFLKILEETGSVSR